MRHWIFRFLALLGVAGCGFWIGSSPREVEPYVTLLGAIAGVLAMFRDRPKADVILSFRPQQEHLQAFVFENVGNANAVGLNMDIHYKQDQRPPVFNGALEMPLSILYPKQRHLVRATCVIGSGAQFDVEWWWNTEGNKKTERRRGLITLDHS